MKRSNRTIPEAFAETLRDLRNRRSEHLNALLATLHEAGWTYQEIGNALGITWQGVQNRVADALPCDDLPDIPLPPPHPKSKTALKDEAAKAARAAKPKITAELAATLLEKYAIARTLRGAPPADHPARQASEEFTALLAELRAEGHNMSAVARVLGVHYDTIRARLGRHGYKNFAPSQDRYKGARPARVGSKS